MISLNNKNEFYNEILNFRITKPKDWVFVPTQWSTKFSENIKFENELLQRVAQQGQQPFVSFYKPHENCNHPYPTVKCSVRMNSDFKVEDEMETVINQFSYMMRCRVIVLSCDYILSGKQCMYAKIQMKLECANGDLIPWLGTIVIVQRQDYVFMIGLNGGAEAPYCCEDTFKEILYSIVL